MESFKPQTERTPSFIFPDVKNELGEVERVAQLYHSETPQEFIEKFILKSAESNLSTLSDFDWSRLENTDSGDVEKGDWVSVGELAESHGRDWKILKTQMESGGEIEAPIIYRNMNSLHLVSGNTRLMVAKALGVRPQVLVVEL